MKTISLNKCEIRIIDFGNSKLISNSENNLNETFCGTPLFMAPQILDGNKYGYKVDVYSLGVISF